MGNLRRRQSGKSRHTLSDAYDDRTPSIPLTGRWFYKGGAICVRKAYGINAYTVAEFHRDMRISEGISAFVFVLAGILAFFDPGCGIPLFAAGVLWSIFPLLEEYVWAEYRKIVGADPKGMGKGGSVPGKGADDGMKYLVYDAALFPREKWEELDKAEIRIPASSGQETCFTEEAVAIHEISRIIYIPYDKLWAIRFYHSRGNRILTPPFQYSCLYLLKNGQEYRGAVNAPEDFEKIAAFIRNEHPEIETDSELIYGRRL